MCGHFTFTAKSLAEAFEMVPPGFTVRSGYNIAPGQYIIIVRPEGPNSEVMITACIITTTPNELMAEIHNRMPVILPKGTWGL